MGHLPDLIIPAVKIDLNFPHCLLYDYSLPTKIIDLMLYYQRLPEYISSLTTVICVFLELPGLIIRVHHFAIVTS